MGNSKALSAEKRAYEVPKRTKTVVTKFETAPAENVPVFASGKPETPPASRDFWVYMDEVLSKRDWTADGLKAYLYRKSKEPDKLGREGYLVRFERPFDVEDLRRLPGCGGGDYTCHVKQGSMRIYVSQTFTVEGPPNPWPSPAGENGAGGDGAVGAVASLIKPLVEQAAGQVAGGVDLKSAVANVLDMQSSAFKSTLASMAEARAGASADASLERAAELFAKLGLIRPASAAGGADDESFFERAAMTFERLGLLKKNKSLAEELTDFMAISERLGGFGFGGGRRGGGSEWAGLARELAPKILDSGVKVVGDFRRMAELRAGAGVRPGPPPAAVVMPAASGPASAPGPAAATAAAPVPPRIPAAPDEAGFIERVRANMAEAPATDAAPASDAAPAAPAVADDEPRLTAWEWITNSVRDLISNGATPDEVAGFLEGAAPAQLDSIAGMSLETLETAFDTDPILSLTTWPARSGGRRAFLAAFLRLFENEGAEGGAEAEGVDAEAEAEGEGSASAAPGGLV